MKTVALATAIALLTSLFGTPLFIKLMRRHGYGQPIRVDGPKTHETKRGTPTMGGAVFVLAALIGYVAAHVATDEPASISGALVLLLILGMGLVGFVDDFIKIFRQTSLGLRSTAKLAGQFVFAAIFALLVLQYPDGYGLTPADPRISFVQDIGPAIGTLPFVIWVVIIIAGTSNAVNLVDGLDGLAAGSTAPVLAAYVLIGLWQARNDVTVLLTPQNYQIRDPLDLAVVAGAVLGACSGYLWWNAPPAKIFMGDTGSLALGGALAGLAICTKTQLLLTILGGLFVATAMSDVIQVGFYKMTKRRVFKMAPLQHHFEMLGWPEVTIVIRFWLLSGLCVALGLSVFYMSWLQASVR